MKKPTKAEIRRALVISRQIATAASVRKFKALPPEERTERMRRVAMARWHPGSQSDHAASVGGEHVAPEVAAQGGE